MNCLIDYARVLCACHTATFVCACLLPLATMAQSPLRQTQAPALTQPAALAVNGAQANLAPGQKLASVGAPNGVAACAGCHGANGEGNTAANFPALAGQPAAYLERQLRSFADGARNNPVMTPIAKAMRADQQRDASAWYASVTPAGAPAVATTTATTPASVQPGSPAPTQGASAKGAGSSAALIRRGMELASRGDDSREVQACANCHGPGGAGEAPTYPSLRGQSAAYFTAAMGEWKSGARKTDPSNQMPSIAQRLGSEQVTALAAYFASLTPSAPAQRTNIPAGTQARPALAARADGSGPPAGAAAATPAGVGSEQGAPLTGGNQGPGGGGGTRAGNPNETQGPGGGGMRPPSMPASPPTQQRKPAAPAAPTPNSPQAP